MGIYAQKGNFWALPSVMAQFLYCGGDLRGKKKNSIRKLRKRL
jgi:hypothetical protein